MSAQGGTEPYLVMELLEGRSLAQELEACGAMSLQRCAAIVAPICSVLAQAHSAGIVHRDLKPSNVFLHHVNESAEIVKIIDFGLAKLIEPSGVDAPLLTLTGEFAGTPAYLAPERLIDGKCDSRADVYSMGVMVYEMLSGHRPFQQSPDGHWAVALMRATERPLSLSTEGILIPEAIASIVDRAISRSPEQRPTVEEFASCFAQATANLADPG